MNFRGRKMKIKFSKGNIEFKKKANALDRFVMKFTGILDKLKIDYVLFGIRAHPFRQEQKF